MRNLKNEIEYIVQKTKELNNKYIDYKDLSLDYVALFTKDSKEFDHLVDEANKKGSLVKEEENAVFYVLNDNNHIPLLKISKPRADRTDYRGYADYKAENFTEFEKNISNLENINRIDLDNRLYMYELKDKDFDVLIYYPNIALGEDLKTANNSIKNEDVEEIKRMIENEKQRRVELMADFQNYQRRVEQEKANWGAIANMGLIRELLEVYDDLQLAMADQNLNLDHAKTSIMSAQDKLIGAALRAGIEKVNVNVGDEFDKEKMEAVSIVPAGDENKGKVIAVISSAYKYVDKQGILKPAKVVVGK
jgi:molecular chaperone GrpE